VRSYKDEVRKHLLASIERTFKAEAAAAGAPREPAVDVTEGNPATYNDPALTARIAAVLREALGEERVLETPPVMGGEDFSEYGRAGVPAVLFWVGAVKPEVHREAKASGTMLPALHSPFFAPDLPRALRTAVEAEAAAVLALLARP
jgi:hippurate hydrolase